MMSNQLSIDKYYIDSIALKKIMVEKELDQISKLSQASNVSCNTIGEIVNGKKMPSCNVMYRIADALDMDSQTAGKVFLPLNLRNA